MTKCDTCDNIEICKRYEAIINFIGTKIDVVSCKHYKSSSDKSTSYIANNYKDYSIEKNQNDYTYKDYGVKIDDFNDNISTESFNSLKECSLCKNKYKEKDMTTTYDLNTSNNVYICDNCFGYDKDSSEA